MYPGNYGCAFLKNTVNISPSSKNPLGDIPCTDVESKLLLPKPPVSDLDLDVPVRVFTTHASINQADLQASQKHFKNRETESELCFIKLL